MAIRVVEVPVAAVSMDAGLRVGDSGYILEHLVRYCSKFEPLPAITIMVEGTTATIVRGHAYLLAARTLGRPTIRAVVANSIGESLEPFLAHAHAKLLDWETIKTAEERDLLPRSWHVFFFARPLTAVETAAFDAVVESLFPGQGLRVFHDDAGPLAEFEASTPVTDHGWMAKHLAAITAFSREWVPVLSFQGRRFGG